MKTKLMFCVFLCLAIRGWGQSASGSLPVDTAAVPQRESIFLHLNTTFFLTGETLYFKVYCLNARSGKLSDLSSIAYLELIGEDQQPLAQMKVQLEHGTGSGDYFFSGNIPSGNYTLIAYTKWMRNFNYSDFFRSNLTVINPQIRPAGSNADSKTDDNRDAASQISGRHPGLAVKIDKRDYTHREKITLNLNVESNASMKLSVNVRLMDAGLPLPASTKIPDEVTLPSSQKMDFLPDLRGELISGTIIEKATGKPFAGHVVTLSSPSQDFQFITSTTDSAGHYYFNTDGITSPYFLLHAQNQPLDNYAVRNDDGFIGEYASFTPPKLALDTTLRELITKRYLSMQVENAFYSVKKDSILTQAPHKRFFTPAKIYQLDDFTRFPTMEDIFREIIPEVVIRRNGGNFSLVVTNSATGFNFSNPPLTLLDGVPVSNANSLMEYDAALVKTISLINRHYFYGGLETDGIISIETYDGEAKNLRTLDVIRVSYTPHQFEKIFYSPHYGGAQDLSRIPDFRTQLYWNPQFEPVAGFDNTISFFTGDLSGPFFIEVIGINSFGEKIHLIEKFTVR